MKYVLFTILAIIMALMAGYLSASLIGRKCKQSTMQKVLITLTVGLLILFAAGAIYLEDYYHADAKVGEYLRSSDSVTIRRDEHGYVFDGPGREQAIIFYPGAKVEETAYAPLLYRLAGQGADCFLLQMPFRMAILDSNAAEEVISGNDYDSYYLMGHSLGGTIAASYSASHPDPVDGVIMLAAYPNTKQNEDDRFLSIYGSNDGCLEQKAYERGKKYWPEDSEEFVIDGGNHSGFGDYGSQNGDGEAVITQDEQQDKTAQIIISWLKK